MLQVVEYLDVGIVGRAVKSQQFAQAVFIIVLVGQFQNRLVQCSTQPYDGTSYQLVVPFAAGYQPWTLNTSQMSCRSQVYANRSVGMKLQVRCRQCITYLVFHCTSDDVSFVFTPGQHINFSGSHNGIDTHGDGAGRKIVYTDIMCSFRTRSCINQNQAGSRAGM